MSFKEKIKPLDELFTLLYLFSPIVSSMLVSFGMDSRLLWLPLFAFMFWTLYIYAYRAKYQLQDNLELSLIERARGITYFFGLVITFAMNGCLFLVGAFEINLIIAVLLFILLFIIEKAVPRTFFRKQTSLFTKNEKTMFDKVLHLTDNVALYYSAIVMSLNTLLLKFISPDGIFLGIVLGTMLFSSIFILLIYQQERESRRIARNLAILLKGGKWLKRYMRRKG